MKTLAAWGIFSIFIGTSLAFIQSPYFADLKNLDPTGLSLGILVFAIGASFFSLYYKELAWLGQSLCMRAGLLGTVIGFMIMLFGATPGSLNLEGMWTALITTATGLVCSTILYVQGWLLGERD